MSQSKRPITVQEIESLSREYVNDPVRKMFIDEISRVYSISPVTIKVYSGRIEHVIDEESQKYINKITAEYKEYEQSHYSELLKYKES